MSTQDTEQIYHDAMPAEFSDIAPYDDDCYDEKIRKLVDDPGFEHAVRYIMPGVDYEEFVQRLLSVRTQDDFQVKVMGPFLEFLATSTTKGITMDGFENYDAAGSYTFVTNHRDIVLDASFLNLCFIRKRLPITQVAIGNNLLISDWITDLVKLNRSFIVKRDVKITQALEAARHLSEYMHYAVANRHESVWIAQREGRAKDSNDVTQESLVKMLSLGGGSDTKGNLESLNIMPVSISYEFDPNDYLKVREFLLRRRDPDFKKSQHDDLHSMEIGIMGQKGRVHFHLGKCLTPTLEAFEGQSRAEVVRFTSTAIDREIHSGYHIYPCNYIAYDCLEGNDSHASFYTAADKTDFLEYVNRQLDKVDVPDITPDEHEFMLRMMFTMYSNPLRNQEQVSR